jgi:hypothetical protein
MIFLCLAKVSNFLVDIVVWSLALLFFSFSFALYVLVSSLADTAFSYFYLFLLLFSLYLIVDDFVNLKSCFHL